MMAQQHERTTTMNTSALMRTASAAVFAVLAVFGAFADDPVYVTGAVQTLYTAIFRVSSRVRLESMERRKDPARMETARFFMTRSAIRIAPREMKIAAMTGMFHSME